MSTGLLLVNLGTPASTAVKDVRSYLGEFLTDPYVIDLPTPLRQIVVRAFILPFRPARSAEAYAKIWDAAGPGTGSPLLHHSETLAQAVADELKDVPCELAMRYGNPSLATAIERLTGRGVTTVKLLCLYPQHADSTRLTTIEAVRAKLPAGMSLEVLPPFYEDAGYLEVQAELIRRHLPQHWDQLLFSYHGLPERHLTQADPTGSHCLASADCCEVASAAHATCYRHQARVTSRRLSELLGLDTAQWSISYQSRLGRLPWLAPYTDQVLERLPAEGVRHLAVACPAFVADNLETLEEIGMAGRRLFMDAGGETFTLIPCLNDDARWVDVIARWHTDGVSAQTNAAPAETAR